MKKVIIYGAGAYASVFFHEAIRYGVIDIQGFTVDEEFMQDKQKYGLPIVPFENVKEIYPCEDYNMIVLCGYSVMRKRKDMYDRAKKKGYQLINYISPGAVVEDGVQMGDNNIIMSNSTVGFGGTMGSNNIIRQNVYLGHEFTIGNHIIISPGCSIGGCSKFGDLAFLGIGVTARSYITYGRESMVGMGSNVTANIEANSVYYGNPAKKRRNNFDTGVVVGEIKSETNL